MRTFKIDENTLIVCNSEGTRSGFRHTANLMINGYQQGVAKICYLNRTWEKFEFQSVMEKLIKVTDLTPEQKSTFLSKINSYG